MRGTFAVCDELFCMGDLGRREFHLAAKPHAAPFGHVPARLCPFLYQGARQFRQDPRRRAVRE